jgi:S1-C subfamily serine protease
MIQRKRVGDTLELTVNRNRKLITLTVTITEYVPETVHSPS